MFSASCCFNANSCGFFGEASQQQLDTLIDNWCHVNVKTSWFQKSVSSLHPLITRPRFTVSASSGNKGGCDTKHSHLVNTLSHTVLIILQGTRQNFLSLSGLPEAPQQPRKKWHAGILPQYPNAPQPEGRGTGAPPSSVQLILIWCSFAISSRKLGNL